MDKKIGVYTEYNKRLYERLERFVLRNKKVFQSTSPKEKLSFLTELEKELGSSAIMKRNMPEKYVPVRKAYHKLYELLFTPSLLRHSYLQILEEGNQKEIEEAEEHIFSQVDSIMENFSFSSKEIPESGLRHYFTKLVDKTVDIVRGEARSINNGMRRVAYLMMVIVAMNCVLPGFIHAAELPYASDQQKKEYALKIIEPTLKEIVKTDLTISENYSRIADIEKKINYLKHSEDVEKRDLLVDAAKSFLEQSGIINQEFWADSLMFHPINEAAARLQRYLQRKVGREYKVERAYRKVVKNNSDIIGEKGFIPIKSRIVTELFEELHNYQGSMKSKLGYKGSWNDIKSIQCGLNNDGNIVFLLLLVKQDTTISPSEKTEDAMEGISLIIVPR